MIWCQSCVKLQDIVMSWGHCALPHRLRQSVVESLLHTCLYVLYLNYRFLKLMYIKLFFVHTST